MTLSSNPLAPRRLPRRIAFVTMLCCAALLAACGGDRGKGASQTAAKVNKEEITVHQINYVLQQQRGMAPEQVDAASRQILERLIDQELAVQKADELGLDRDPRVVQRLEAVKREVLARAYAEKVGEAATPPSAEDIKAYYDAHPELFSERRVYNLQEIAIEASAEQVPALRKMLQAAKNIGEFVEHLKSTDIRFAANQAVRAAEQLPLASLKTFASLQAGQAVMNTTPQGVQVVVLAGVRQQPVNEAQARPAIEQFILNDRKRKLLEDDRKAQRAAASLEYVGKFAEAPPAAEPEAAPMITAPAAGPAASGGLDASTISKGLGIK